LLAVRVIRELGKDAPGLIRLHVEKADIAIVEDDFKVRLVRGSTFVTADSWLG
jgi:hypothetical protein